LIKDGKFSKNTASVFNGFHQFKSHFSVVWAIFTASVEFTTVINFKMMRIVLCLAALFILSGCSQKPLDIDSAKKVVEQLITETDAENFDKLEDLYTAEFNNSEPLEVKKEKLLQLKSVLGNVTGIEFLSSTLVEEFGQPRKLVLEYRVLHTRINSIEKFSVVEAEGGYRIASHSVQSENVK
jgi:hypothetical protein